MSLQDQMQDLVIANRILADQGVVDAFGHASIRHPERPDLFIMARSRSPELVEMRDLCDFGMDGEPVVAEGSKPFAERFIHAGVYEARPDVQAVIHNHSQAVIPFSVTGVPLKPIMHVAATMGPSAPVWDIHDCFGETDLLVTNMEQARDLARKMGSNTVALMRGHGSVVVGSDIRTAVVSAVYMQANARMQIDAMRMGDVRYLSDEEVRMAGEKNLSPFVVNRVWECWTRRVLDELPGGG